jgi:hypothetical protein
VKAWEVWQYKFPWGEHPVVIVSNELRVKLKPQIMVLSCRTMQPATFRNPEIGECLLDEADGLDWKTLCRCDLFWTVEKKDLFRHRGEVMPERRRDIARKMLGGLAIAGL